MTDQEIAILTDAKLRLERQLLAASFADPEELIRLDLLNQLLHPSGLHSTPINRVEVIDERGRSYVNHKETNHTRIQVQDNGRTLKVFIGPRG